MRYFDGILIWLGLLSTVWCPEPALRGFGPLSVAWTAGIPHKPNADPHPNGVQDSKVAENMGPSAEETKTKRIPVAEQRRLVGILVEMQKRSEQKEGFHHKKEEEIEVDAIFEGDIILTLAQAEELLQDLSHRRKRKLAESLTKRWTPPIAYIFDGSHTSEERFRIRQALAYWEELTCITFREDPRADHKLYFVKGTGCWSYVGFTGQVNQTVSIGPGCQSNGTIAHEVGHAVGFWHEQSRPDRDDYIHIHKANVNEAKLYNFEARTWGEIVTMDIPYDLGSDMHYGSTFYARDPNSTFTTVETNDPLMTRVIGQRQELSFYDVKLTNKAYCEGLCSTYGIRLQQPCRRDGYQDPKDCRRCRCPGGFGGDWCERVSPSVNAYCGGTLSAHTTPGWIYSPGYPNPGYGIDVECSWLIRAPPNNRVYFEFVGDFGISGHTDVCKDFVEIRYNTSLSLTGARFCCNDPPRHPIVSETGEMLILFRTYEESRVCDDRKYPWKCQQVYTGFRGKFYYKSCGGCASTYDSLQPACVKRITYTCAQSWTEKVKIDCPRWWYTDSCGERTVSKARYAKCSRDQFYCCNGFSLDGNRCKGPGTAQKRSYNVLPPTSNDPLLLSDDESEHYQTAATSRPGPPAVRWTQWSAWGDCSVTCGGGTRVRQRRCISPGYCGASNIQVDPQPCNQAPCLTTCAVQKTIICDMWTRCTRTVQEACKKCNDNHRLVENTCIPHAA